MGVDGRVRGIRRRRDGYPWRPVVSVTFQTARRLGLGRLVFE